MTNIRLVPGGLLVVATKNPGKLVEFKAALGGLGLTILSLDDFPRHPPIVESGRTFRENAMIKAEIAFEYTGCAAVADDSGLMVDYLGGAPGVLSARFAGKDGDDEANNAKLLRLLAGVPKSKRGAQFQCVLVLILPGGRVLQTAGTVEGYIGNQARGKNGFGYDPLFVIPEYRLTFGELALEKKNAISHRGRALRKLRCLMEKEFG